MLDEPLDELMECDHEQRDLSVTRHGTLNGTAETMESIARTLSMRKGGARDRIVTVTCYTCSVAFLGNNSECADVPSVKA